MSELIKYHPEGHPRGSIRKCMMLKNGVKRPFIKCYFHGVHKHFHINKWGEEQAIEEAKKWLEEYVPLVKERQKELIDGQHNKYMSRVYIEMVTKKDKLPRWNIKDSFNDKENYTMALIGSTKSGKSTLLNYLIPKIHNKFDIIVLFSVNEHSDVYRRIKDLDNVISFDHFISDVVEDLHKINKKTSNSLKFLIVMDDEIDNKNNKTVKNMFCTYRNAGISSIFSGQDFSFIAKNVRNNINYTAIFKQNSEEAYEAVIDKFLKGALKKLLFGNMSQILKRKMRLCDQYESMYNYVTENTKDHNILILDNINDMKLYNFKVNLY